MKSKLVQPRLAGMRGDTWSPLLAVKEKPLGIHANANWFWFTDKNHKPCKVLHTWRILTAYYPNTISKLNAQSWSLWKTFTFMKKRLVLSLSPHHKITTVTVTNDDFCPHVTAPEAMMLWQWAVWETGHGGADRNKTMENPFIHPSPGGILLQHFPLALKAIFYGKLTWLSAHQWNTIGPF